MSRKRILLADDHALFRHGLANTLKEQPDFEVVGQARDGFEAFQLTRQLAPDLVIMDIRMPISDGIEATTLIRSQFSSIKILILTVQEDNDSLFTAIKAGANGYMLKNVSPTDFIKNIRLVLDGSAVIPPKLAANLLTEFARLSSQTPSSNNLIEEYNLTDREAEILTLITAEYTNDEIAKKLVISINTVKTHVRNILKKLHASNRQEATQIAYHQGLLSDTSPDNQSPED